jgi:hypothetical protein
MRCPARLLAVLIALIAALVLTACGGGNASSSSGSDATALIKETFGANHPIRSGLLDANLDVDLQGLPRFQQPISLHLSGPFQTNGGKTLPDFALELDLNGGSRPVTVGATFAQQSGFLTVEGRAFTLGPQIYDSFKQGYVKAKADAAAKGGTSSLSALGISPLRWLRAPRTQGTEDIGGTQSDHVTAEIDVPRLLEDLSTLLGKARGVAQAGGAATGTTVPTQLTASQRDLIARSVKSATIDVWSGHGDHTLRKVALDVRIAVPQELQARAGGLRSGSIALQVTLARLNEHQTIHQPTGARPIGELRAALQQLGLLGTSSASTTTNGSTTTPAPAPASGPQGDYAKCLNQAGNDLAKVQTCAGLLK